MSKKRGERGRAQATIDLIATCIKIIEPCQPISVRGVCYKLFVAGLIDSMAVKNTQKVSRILRQAREEGQIPWEWIVDDSRSLEWVPAWSNLEEYSEKIARDYRRDFWSDQGYDITIVSEKSTVAGILNPLLNSHGVNFFASHGFNSATKVHELANRIRGDGRQFVFLYVGDHDPSGMHMSEVDFPERLREYGAKDFKFNRIALMASDTTNLPDFPAKKTDPRYPWYRKLYGDRAWELDAMDPATLRNRVTVEIEKYMDSAAWVRHRRIEQAQRRTTKMIAAQLAAMEEAE